MNLTQTMKALKKLGTAQNVKVYKRHGAGEKLFGVSFADLKKLQKQVKADHNLAEELWATGNADARTFALMIADPDQLKSKQADAWMSDVSYYLLGNMLAGVVANSTCASAKLKKWARSKKEFTRQCGYDVLCCMLKDDPNQIENKQCEAWLATIEKDIHQSPNRARHAMNMALSAIGIYKPSLRKKTIAVARRIGKVTVDHGETSCKTPDAEEYILHAASRTPPKRKKVAPRKVAAGSKAKPKRSARRKKSVRKK